MKFQIILQIRRCRKPTSIAAGTKNVAAMPSQTLLSLNLSQLNEIKSTVDSSLFLKNRNHLFSCYCTNTSKQKRLMAS